VWAYRHILGWEDELFKATPQAIDINDTRALHVPQLVRDALRNLGLPIAAADILVLGASWRPWAPACACTTPTWRSGPRWRRPKRPTATRVSSAARKACASSATSGWP